MTSLSPQAAAALAHVARSASGPPIDPAWRVTLNFHPDRIHRGVTVLQALVQDRVYRSQFETGTSNGGLTAHAGGDRWRWEQRIFGGAYDEVHGAERPKYGALNPRGRSVGGAPRFGSAHLRLASHALERTTFCYPDSVFEPRHLGTAAHLDLVERADADAAEGSLDPLDHYVEAHVHGLVDLAEHVEAVVLDPCFHGTRVEDAANRMPCPVEWHAGFEVDLAVVRAHPEYRGAEVVALAEEVVRGGRLDPAVIGDAAVSGQHDPQLLKRVWHYLARFGSPD